MQNINIVAKQILKSEYSKDAQEVKYNLLVGNKYIVQVLEVYDEQIHSIFVVLDLQQGQTKQHLFKDRVYKPQVYDNKYVVYFAKGSNNLMFFSISEGTFSQSIDGYAPIAAFIENQIIKEQPQHRDLYYNTAASFSISNKNILLLVDGISFGMQQFWVQIVNESHNLIFRDTLQRGNAEQDGSLQIYPIHINSSFVLMASSFKDTYLQYHLFTNNHTVIQSKCQCNITIVDCIQLNNKLLFIGNSSTIGAVQFIVSDATHTKPIELQLCSQNQQFDNPIVYQVLYCGMQKFYIHYQSELGNDGQGQPQFIEVIQAIKYSEDLSILECDPQEIRIYKENALLCAIFNNKGFLEIPKAQDLGPIPVDSNDQYEIDLLDKDSNLSQECYLLYYYAFANEFHSVFHLLNKMGILDNLGLEVAELVIQKIQDQESIKQGIY